MNVKIMTDSDICALCGSNLREGLTELALKAGDNFAVIKKVPALVCSCCGEAYLTPEVSERIDKDMKEYGAREAFGKAIGGGRD